MGRPSLITQPMEDFIYNKLIKKPRPTANSIHQSLIKYLEGQKIPDSEIPGEDAIIKRITKLRKTVVAHPPSDLDNPFTIGDCLKYQITLTPALLTEYQSGLKYENEGDYEKTLKEFNVPLDEALPASTTIREARWLNLLYPHLMSRIKAKRPELKPLVQLGRVSFIAGQYASLEQICEISERPMDTRYLDTTYFVKEDYSDETIIKYCLALTDEVLIRKGE